MPSIWQVRKRRAKTRRWTKEAMEQAIQEVQAGRLKALHAAQKFGLPKSTLYDRITGRVAATSFCGRNRILTAEDEKCLVEYCLYSACQGSPLTKSQVMAHALAIYNYRNPDQPKTVVGDKWWLNFRERNHRRLSSQSPDMSNHGKESCMTPLSPTSAPSSPDAAHPFSNCYLNHPLVASGCITADLAHILTKTNQTCDTGQDTRNAQVLTAQVKSDVIEARGDTVQQQQRAEDASPAATSCTLPGDSHLSCIDGPSGASASHSRTPSHQSPQGHIATKRQKHEKRILRCGWCRQSYPPKDPEGLVLWVQCDGCHRLFHTICVSSEIDLDADQFWCFGCLDV